MMESDVLRVINDELTELSINYEYDEYSGPLAYPYVVGEYSENSFAYEDGSTNAQMILTAFMRGSRSALIDIKEKIKARFCDYRKTTASGVMSITYSQSLFLRTGKEDLKRIDIYLDIKLWEGK